MTPRHVELFVDPICPFAWMASRWLLHAAQVREIAPTFSIMSLAVLNEGREMDEAHRRSMDEAWGPARLMAAIAERFDQESVAAFYTAFGQEHHVGGNGDRRECAQRALAAADLPEDLISLYDSEDLDASLRTAQARVQGMVGDDVGTPVISFGEGVAYFGPVISPAPKGEDAGLLLDALEAASRVPGFFELKRSRTNGIDFS